MTASLWMSTKDVAAESPRHHESVLLALKRGLLTGTQSHPGARWQISRKAFQAWMERGAPVDTPAQARVRRSA